MPYKQFGLDRLHALVASLLFLLTGTGYAFSQTGDDGTPASPDDNPEVVAQTDAEPSIPTLDQMLRIALQHNPDIRAARAEVSVAEANLDRTRLTVVKELTAFRDRWLSAEASLAAAEAELAEFDRLSRQGLIAQTQVTATQYQVSALQLKLRELEAELPFLLGQSPNADSMTTGGHAPEDQRKLAEDEAIPLAEQILALSLQSLQTGEGDVQKCLMWSSRLMQFQRDIAESEADRNSAVEQHQARLQELLNIAEARFQMAIGRMEDILAVRLALIEVELLTVGGSEAVAY